MIFVEILSYGNRYVSHRIMKTISKYIWLIVSTALLWITQECNICGLFCTRVNVIDMEHHVEQNIYTYFGWLHYIWKLLQVGLGAARNPIIIMSTFGIWVYLLFFVKWYISITNINLVRYKLKENITKGQFLLLQVFELETLIMNCYWIQM